MATVTHVVLPDGTHAIGVGSGKKFVPFVTLSEARYNQLEENESYDSGSSKAKTEGGDK